MMFKYTKYGYKGFSIFVDRSTTMALRREKFAIWQREREQKAWQKKKEKIEEENAKKLMAGASPDELEQVPPRPEVPHDPRLSYSWDNNFGIGLDCENKESQSYKQICGSMFDEVYAGNVGSREFEEDYGKLFPSLEVMKLTQGHEARALREKQKERTRARRDRQDIFFELDPERFKHKKEIHQRLKTMSVDEWIMCVISLFKTVPLLVNVIDLDVKRIAFNSDRYYAKRCSTITQLETILRLNEQKEMLLNIYVLNKIFAGITLTYDERMVFLTVMQKSLPTTSEESQRLRTAYRTRRKLLRRFREFCLRRGYTEDWFYDHFAFLPCVQYYMDKLKEGEDKRLKELQMEAQEYKNDGVDVLSFLADDDNIEGRLDLHEDISKKAKIMSAFRRARNKRVLESGGDLDKARRNEAKNFAYRLGAAREFDYYLSASKGEMKNELKAELGKRTSKEFFKQYMKEVKDYDFADKETLEGSM